MKIAIIGGSGHFDYAINSIKSRKDLELVAIAKGCENESLEWLKKVLMQNQMECSEYEDYHQMLKDKEVDLCIINSHFNMQSVIGADVLRKNIHAFIEKPLATTLDELYELEKTYRGSEAKICAMFGIRYKACFLKAKELIENDAIGKIRLMDARKSYKLGNRKDFYKKRETYGGTIPWVGSHAIDWLRWLSGYEVVSVRALNSTEFNQNHGDLETSAVCTLELENQCFGNISIDYFRPANALTHDDDRVRIVGTKGIIEIQNSMLYLINQENDGTQPVALGIDYNIFEDFINSILGQGECIVSPDDSFKVSEICLKAQLSADENGALQNI